MKRIAIYQRGYIAEEDKRAMTDFAASIPGARITHRYWDHDGSDRAEYRALIAAAREGDVDVIIVQSIVRFSPSTVELLDAIKELHQHGVSIYFAKEKFWGTGITSWLLWSILAATAKDPVFSQPR